jgi:flagellar biosynthetic protein FlhB
MSARDSRTEKATGRRRQKAREKGQVLRSREVSAALAFAVVIGALHFMGSDWWRGLEDTMRFFLTNLSQEPAQMTLGALGRAAWAGAPLVGLAVAASLAGNHLQSPLGLSATPLRPDLGKISPQRAFSTIFSTAGLSQLFRAVVGITAVTFVCWNVVGAETAALGSLDQVTPRRMGAFTAGLALRLGLWCAAVFAFIALVDYGLSYRRFEESLKMSRQEVKDEAREVEGNPVIKQRVRRVQKAMARRRMMAAVPKATVVVTNPTHLAVALTYDQKGAPAPQVVAKGKGEVAARIREIARTHDVPIYEDPPLARALYPLDIGAVIPPSLYQAVAAVLAHLMRLGALSRGKP